MALLVQPSEVVTLGDPVKCHSVMEPFLLDVIGQLTC